MKLTTLRPGLASMPSPLQRLGGAPAPRRSVNWYSTARWQRLRASVIAAATSEAADRGDVLRCCRSGVPLLGQHPAPDSPVVHHRQPHRGDPAMFWDERNLEVVAKGWHDGPGQAGERRGS